MGKKCDICDNQEYEKPWLYDVYKKILDIDVKNEHLNSALRKKLEGFVKEKKPCIYVCYDCEIEMLGKNRVKE